ncbi:hypothetical protein Tco_0019515 [Tanacetum coccineum]
MENEHELSYETLTRVYLGSYEHYKGVVADKLETSKLGVSFKDQTGAKTGHFRGSYGAENVCSIGLEKEERYEESIQSLQHNGMMAIEMRPVVCFRALMSYLVASSTLDSARTYVMQGAPFTQGTIPSIPIGSSISPEGFLLLILLLVVIIVTVVIVIVILIVVVDDPLDYVDGFLQSLRLRGSNISFNTSRSSRVVPGVHIFGEVYSLALAIDAVWDELDNVVEEEDGEWIRFLGGNSFSGIKKYRGLNSSDGGNIGDRVKIAGGVIGSGDEIESQLEGPMKDQPLSADASPTTLSPSYIANFKPKEDEKDPEEDPADYPANEGDNSDDESSDDDDVEKDEEDGEEEEHLAPADPSVVPTNDLVPSS